MFLSLCILTFPTALPRHGHAAFRVLTPNFRWSRGCRHSITLFSLRSVHRRRASMTSRITSTIVFTPKIWDRLALVALPRDGGYRWGAASHQTNRGSLLSCGYRKGNGRREEISASAYYRDLSLSCGVTEAFLILNFGSLRQIGFHLASCWF